MKYVEKKEGIEKDTSGGDRVVVGKAAGAGNRQQSFCSLVSPGPVIAPFKTARVRTSLKTVFFLFLHLPCDQQSERGWAMVRPRKWHSNVDTVISSRLPFCSYNLALTFWSRNIFCFLRNFNSELELPWVFELLLLLISAVAWSDFVWNCFACLEFPAVSSCYCWTLSGCLDSQRSMRHRPWFFSKYRSFTTPQPRMSRSRLSPLRPLESILHSRRPFWSNLLLLMSRTQRNGHTHLVLAWWFPSSMVMVA